MSVSPQHHPTADPAGGTTPPAGGSRLGERLLLLAQDPSLIDALGAVVPPERLTLVADEASLASHLVGEHIGVVFIDAGLPKPGTTAQLAARLHAQLPEVVLVVAGDGATQSELAALVADGTIYRFVHKPVSAQRVKLFVDAAWRKREGHSASGVYPALTVPPPPETATAGPRPRSPPLPWPPVMAGGAVIVAALAWLLMRGHAHDAAPPPSAARREASAAPPASVPAVSSAAGIAASSAVTPAPSQEFDRLATDAEQALLSGDLAEATRLTEAARALDPNHVRVRFLTAQIAREQARVSARRRTADSQAGQTPQSLRGAAATSIATPTPATAAAAGGSAPQAVAASAPSAAVTSAPAEAPSSTPPASEAHDRNSVAAVILHRIYSVDPDFPDAAREHDVTGYVDLEFTVQADGKVSDVTVLKALPVGVFERAAIAAVKQWRYAPITRNGAPTTERARLRLNFAYK